jgi:hypothetical protein
MKECAKKNTILKSNTRKNLPGPIISGVQKFNFLLRDYFFIQ